MAATPCCVSFSCVGARILTQPAQAIYAALPNNGRTGLPSRPRALGQPLKFCSGASVLQTASYAGLSRGRAQDFGALAGPRALKSRSGRATRRAESAPRAIRAESD